MYLLTYFNEINSWWPTNTIYCCLSCCLLLLMSTGYVLTAPAIHKEWAAHISSSTSNQSPWTISKFTSIFEDLQLFDTMMGYQKNGLTDCIGLQSTLHNSRLPSYQTVVLNLWAMIPIGVSFQEWLGPLVLIYKHLR